MRDYIKVTGISSKGTQRVMNYNYPMFVENNFQAIKKVIEWADEEYTCEYDENHKPIPDTTYKEFEEITSIEVFNFNF